jgi:hypothetical protein
MNVSIKLGSPLATLVDRLPLLSTEFWNLLTKIVVFNVAGR